MRCRPEIPGSGTQSSSHGSEGEGTSPASRQRQQQIEAASTLAAALGTQHDTVFEPIPRARKRKPG